MKLPAATQVASWMGASERARNPPLVIPSEAKGCYFLHLQLMSALASLSATSQISPEAPPSPCHPERSRGICCAPFLHATAQGSYAVETTIVPKLSHPRPPEAIWEERRTA